MNKTSISYLPIALGSCQIPEHWPDMAQPVLDSKCTPIISNAVDTRNRSVGDKDILVIDEVAKLLRCSQDQVRRIPREELPTSIGPGRFSLYLREDVLNFLRNRSSSERRNSGLSKRRNSVTSPKNVGAMKFDPKAARKRLSDGSAQ